ncbi:hypothetical protein, partial [Butyricimonas virosa]
WQVEKNPIHTRRTVSLPTGLEPTSLKCFKDNIGKKNSRNSSFYTRKKWLQQVSHYQQLLITIQFLNFYLSASYSFLNKYSSAEIILL